jgi:hypothetical protein
MYWSAWSSSATVLGSGELFGRHLEPVSVALHGLVEPGGWVAEFSQQCGGGDGRFIAGEDLFKGLGRCPR